MRPRRFTPSITLRFVLLGAAVSPACGPPDCDRGTGPAALATTAEELAELEGFTRLDGLIVRLEDDGDLRSLSCLRRVEGNLLLSRGSFDSLAGLESLEHVEGVMTVSALPELTSLRGLESLAFADWLALEDLPRIESLEGLEGLTHLGRTGLTVVSNGQLKSLAGAENLRRLDGGFSIDSNANLVSVSSLSGLEEVVGGIAVRNNPSLAACDDVVLARSFDLADVGPIVLQSDIEACGGLDTP